MCSRGRTIGASTPRWASRRAVRRSSSRVEQTRPSRRGTSAAAAGRSTSSPQATRSSPTCSGCPHAPPSWPPPSARTLWSFGRVDGYGWYHDMSTLLDERRNFTCKDAMVHSKLVQDHPGYEARHADLTPPKDWPARAVHTPTDFAEHVDTGGHAVLQYAFVSGSASEGTPRTQPRAQHTFSSEGQAAALGVAGTAHDVSDGAGTSSQGPSQQPMPSAPQEGKKRRKASKEAGGASQSAPAANYAY